MQIRQKTEAKEIKEKGEIAGQDSHVRMSRGYSPPPPLGIFNQTRPSERTFCIYCNRIFIAPFLFQFIKNHFCLLSSKKVKKITTLLTGLTRSKMYAIKYILYKPYCGPYKCSLRGHRNSYLAWAKFWQRTHAKTITPAMQATKNQQRAFSVAQLFRATLPL